MYHADSGAEVAAGPEDLRAGEPSDLSIVVVSYNTRPHLEMCLETLRGTARSVTVVDNASTDGGPDLVRDRFPAVELLELERNVGYGAAANAGMAASPAEFFLILNSDVKAPPTAIERLLAYGIAHPDVGIAAPRLFSPDGPAQQSLSGYPTEWWTGRPPITSARASVSGRLLAPLRRPLNRLNGLPGHFLVGAALLIRGEALKRVGGFDPSFFLFSEDVDLCLRMQQAGWGVELCPGISFIHFGGAATSQNWTALSREHLRSHLRFLAKHRGGASAERARRWLLLSTRARIRLSRGDQRRALQETAAWLGSASAASLVENRPR